MVEQRICNKQRWFVLFGPCDIGLFGLVCTKKSKRKMQKRGVEANVGCLCCFACSFEALTWLMKKFWKPSPNIFLPISFEPTGQ
jgi:hypothetical protein